MIENLLEIDREVFLFLNRLHTPWLDSPMTVLSNTISWLPLYVFLVYLIIKDFKKEWWIILIGIALTITLSDQITSSFMKPYFERLRPSHEPALQGLVHHVNNYKGGLYGFASSHAANTFGVATFLFMLFSKTRKLIWALFVWAIFVSYTRIYLGVHYPGDLIAGWVVGSVCALGCYWLTSVSLEHYLQGQNSSRIK